jgi:hypothetical protein
MLEENLRLKSTLGCLQRKYYQLYFNMSNEIMGQTEIHENALYSI